MTPLKRIQAAIERLEQHVGETWLRDSPPSLAGWVSETATISASNPGGGRHVTGPICNSDADLIVTLHRTIEAQLRVLAYGATMVGDIPDAILDLADAILGSDS